MSIIYEPKGEAREYAPLALNIYRGCVHRCRYCYVPGVMKMTREEYHSSPMPKRDLLKRLATDAERFRGNEREILVSFVGDPYQPDNIITRETIQILIENDLRFTVLTKGGMRAVKDFDLLGSYNRCRFGSTIIFINQPDADKWELNAATIEDRIMAIREAHDRKIRTWVSIEPTIDPDQALELVRQLHPFVDHWKVGKLNYHQPDKRVNWIKFREDVICLLSAIEADYYIKQSLRRIS